jgi:acid phosphatase
VASVPGGVSHLARPCGSQLHRRPRRAVSQPSNYLAVLSGSTHGITGDSCPQPPGNQPNLARQLLDTGRGFTGYSEDLPSVCFTGCSAPDRRYARNHKPSVDFANLPQDLAALPTVAVVVPNLCPTCTTAP